MMMPLKISRIRLLSVAILSVFGSGLSVASAAINRAAPDRPGEFDVRGPDGVPKGTALRAPTAAQAKALTSLQNVINAPLVVQYNGLTGTPRHLFSHSNYLTQAKSAPPVTIALEFLSKWRGIWRFNHDDLRNLRLKSRATIPDTGGTILLFEQQLNGLPVYKGEVLVNINGSGQIISIGNDNFPQMQVTNSFTISPAEAVAAAAASLGVNGFAPQSSGSKQVLKTFGDLPHEFEVGQRFSGGGVFTDEIVVTRVVFPLGDEGRAAYEFTLTTPQYEGIMWHNIVDAKSGQVLRRVSLTAFQKGGGLGVGRRGTLRPDIQDMLEGLNPGGTARGKVFDSNPTAMSGYLGAGRSAAPGTPPTYDDEGDLFNWFRRSLAEARNESPLIYDVPFGQVTRGLPDAVNPTAASPFGWFYLPTGNSGAEIAAGEANANRVSTRAYGYNLHPTARARNLAANSPAGDGGQPFSATVTPLPGAVTTKDGRTLTSVIQSSYAEGNNVLVADDHQNDDESTHGIRGFSPERQFTASYFDFTNSYEYGGVPASEGNIPATAFPDTYPAAATMFYYTNIMHDYMYSLGFTEATWNFQQDNFGNGGAGGDGLSAQVQDGSGIDNGNFSTPNDGSPPRMQMYLMTDVWHLSDADFDFDFVAHEYYHGVSNRSVGKGTVDCLGVGLVGESGGMGEGWGDFIAASMADDDAVVEYATGFYPSGPRRLPLSNFRWSYGAMKGVPFNRRDSQIPPDGGSLYLAEQPFAVHWAGELWAATLWDMRELMIMRQNDSAVFFDGTRRLGSGTAFYIGNRQVQSVDTLHPIDYRASFGTSQPGTAPWVTSQWPSLVASDHIVRPGAIAAEIAALGHRHGALATAIRDGARLADTLVLRSLQLAPCHPSFVDMRDTMLLADRELTGGENQAIIWRAFASHGIGTGASSTSSGDPASQSVPVIVEDFTVPAGVAACEQQGPLSQPSFTLSSPVDNAARVSITALADAATFIISRRDTAVGPFQKIAEIPATETAYDDNNLPGGRTYFFQVRATRNPECVSPASTDSVFVAGADLVSAPIFKGVDQVADPRDGVHLLVSWLPATSLNPNANIVYDVYRVDHVDHNRYTPGVSEPEPTFTPSATNRIAQGVNTTSFLDSGLVLNQVYYYIVQARDLNNGRKDTNSMGNQLANWNAPTIVCITAPAPFALETFESSSANTRFAPPLQEAGNPMQDQAVFQRVSEIPFSAGITSSTMYAPNFDQGSAGAGAPSDFSAIIGPLMLSSTSVMEFDHFFNTEATFDGGVVEISVGARTFNATPYPDNSSTFDLGDYMIEGGYIFKLDGTGVIPGAFLSHLQGRRAFTGLQGLDHVRISLKNFAPGERHNLSGAPVYIRFRMTSDAATTAGADSGWYIDNVVINNLGADGLQLDRVVSRKAHGPAGSFDISLPFTGAPGIECRTGGANGDFTLVFSFAVPLASVAGADVASGQGEVSSSGIGSDPRQYVVNLTGVADEQVITVTLAGVNDTCGNNSSAISASMGVLIGDTTGDRFVNSSDISQTKSKSGQAVDTSNFRADVTVSGSINSSDISLVKSKSGAALP